MTSMIPKIPWMVCYHNMKGVDYNTNKSKKEKDQKFRVKRKTIDGQIKKKRLKEKKKIMN